MPKVPIFTAPLHGRKLTPAAWRKIETLLDTWKGEVLTAARRHPAKSYKLGVAQIEAYSDLVTGMRSATAETMFGGVGPTMRHAEEWMRTYTLHELDDALNVYVGRIKDALLYGLRHGLNPAAVASMMFDATQDAQVNWRLIARTEMVRANTMGRYKAIADMGYDRVWFPPHVGACSACKRLLENRVFLLADIIDNSNFGREPRDWVPCSPLHPQCRHPPLPYDPDVHAMAMEHYGALEAAGLTDEKRLAEMFDDSGQLRPGYTVADVDPDTYKSMEPFAEVLAVTIERVRKARRGEPATATRRRELVPIDELRVDLYQRELEPAKSLGMLHALRRGEHLEPPSVSLREDGTYWIMDGQHRVDARRLHGQREVLCDVEHGLAWDEESRICREAIAKTWNAFSAGDDLPGLQPIDVTKITTLAGAAEIALGNMTAEYDAEYSDAIAPDPLLWDGARLRDEISLAVETWWASIAGADWRAFSHLYVPLHGPVRAEVDYAALRAARGEYSKLADEDLHFALVAATRNAGREIKELAPGLPMDLRIEPDQVLHARPDWEWHIGSQRWRDGQVPPLIEKTAAAVMPDYRWSGAPTPAHERLLGSDEYETWVNKAYDPDEPRDQFGKWTADQIRAAAHAYNDSANDPEAHHAIEHGHPHLSVTAVRGAGSGRGPLRTIVVPAIEHDGGHWHATDPQVHNLRQFDGRLSPEDTARRATKRLGVHGAKVDVVYRTVGKADAELLDVAKTGAGPVRGWHVAPAAARAAILEHGLIEAQPNDRWARYNAAKEPAGIYVWTTRARAMKWAADMARLVGGATMARNDVWEVDLDGLEQVEHTDPVLGDQGAIYLAIASVPAQRLSLVATKTTSQILDVAKATDTPGAGVEHWITIHPNGDEAKGQPVLVRNNADGTMSVIGGAGGNLNYLRLDPSRRIDKPADGAKPKSDVQAVSQEEDERSQADREQELEAARGHLDEAKARQTEAQDRLHAFARDELGIDLTDATPAERRKLLAKLRVSAARTLSYGEIRASDRADSPDPEQLGDGTPKAPTTDEELAEQEHQIASDASPEAEDGIARPPRPSMAMSAEHAASLLDHFGDIRAIQRIASQHRRVIAGEKPPSDANQIDWSLGGETARDERRAKALESMARTDLARDLLNHGDAQVRSDKRGGTDVDAHYRVAFQQGGFDSIDSFSHSILGHNLLSRASADLLGVAGAAQLAAHAIQQEAGRDVGKITDALKGHTDEQERAIADRGLSRVKRAADLATTAGLELAKSQRGEGLFTTTMAKSLQSKKVREAKNSLGMMIGGLEACSALKYALERPQGAKIKVGGFNSPSQVREAAQRAGVKLTASEIVRVGSGNYSLHIDPDRLMGLVKPDAQADAGLRARLRDIRTGKDLDREIADQRRTPGMADTLDANQAKGKMFLNAAGSGLLGFDPGVGKTHTAIAAAMEKMAAEPGKHRALIVAPTNMLGSWAKTIQGQDPKFIVSTVGANNEGKTKKIQQLMDPDAHFTVVSYETLKAYRKQLSDATAAGEHVPHSIVIADELQKAKNPDSDNYGGVQKAVDLASSHHGPSQPDGKGASFWGLTGTPIEKDIGDLNTMRNLVARARGGEGTDRKTARRKYGDLGQSEHIARGDKVAQFRDSLDADLFRLSAHDAGNDLGEPTRVEHSAPLTPEHEESFRARVQSLNEQIADYHARKESNGGDGGGRMPEFGGRRALMDELYGREDSSLVKSCADEVAKTGSFDFKGMPSDHEPAPGEAPKYSKGDFAGTYEHKHVVFGANETTSALFGKDPDGNGFDKKARGGLAKELRDRGVKVFIGHGSMGSSAANEASYEAFLAHGGKAVFLTNDKNNAGISLQFGDHKGDFQHGATHLHHFTRPVNNATIQQREARILRKGAAAGATYHTYNAGTPLELSLQETLEREARTQDLAANAEQRVAGADTLRHKLSERGVKTTAA